MILRKKEEIKNEGCTKKIAVEMAKAGLIRGIVHCPVCGFGHSPYDVIKQPEKYKEFLIPQDKPKKC